MSTLDLDTIQALLGEEKQKEEEKHLGGTDLWYKHGFERRLRYLFDLPYERMFLPWESKIRPENPYYRCIGCGRMVRNRESHFNWHKTALGDLK